MQLRRLAALERQKIIDEHDRLQALIEDLEDILATPARQRTIISEELAAIVEQYGDERRTEIVPSDAEVNMEDLIPDENVVVTITRGGYAKRIRVDAYRSQRRGGKGVRGTTLRADDVVDHFFTTQTHGWLLFFTDAGASTGRGPGSCPRARATPRASTSPTSWPSARTRRSPRC